MIAMALVQPDAVDQDEPTTALDDHADADPRAVAPAPAGTGYIMLVTHDLV
jgi:ABC-type dipeptide/oligopeptide/nickel transport system ATPase component